MKRHSLYRLKFSCLALFVLFLGAFTSYAVTDTLGFEATKKAVRLIDTHECLKFFIGQNTQVTGLEHIFLVKENKVATTTEIYVSKNTIITIEGTTNARVVFQEDQKSSKQLDKPSEKVKFKVKGIIKSVTVVSKPSKLQQLPYSKSNPFKKRQQIITPLITISVVTNLQSSFHLKIDSTDLFLNPFIIIAIKSKKQIKTGHQRYYNQEFKSDCFCRPPPYCC